MDLAGLFWHLSNFFAAPIGLAVIAALMAKLLWRHSLKAVQTGRLVAIAVLASIVASVVGLLLLGQDGKMLTYAVMVLATAAVLWWAGRPR